MGFYAQENPRSWLQFCTATVVMAKGEDKYVTTELKRFLLEAGRTTAIIQTDQEPTILRPVVK
jgi:hypothetical protein